MAVWDDVLATIKEAAQAGRVVFWDHARDQMNERGVDVDDVMSVLLGPETAQTAHRPNRWCVVGADLDGDHLTVVVELEWADDVAVVTIF